MTSILNFDRWQSTAGVLRNAILQVQFKQLTTGVITTSPTAWTNIESLSITPRFNNSTMIVMANYGASGNGAIRLTRGATVLSAGDPTSNQTYQHFEADAGASSGHDSGTLRTQFTLSIFDTPNTTSAVTYTTQIIAYDLPTDGFSVQAIGPYTSELNIFSGLIIMEVAR